VISRLDLDRWESFDRDNPAPTFFARPAFARAYCDAFSHCEPWPIFVELHPHGYVIPAIRSTTRLGFRHAIALPLGGYSCVLDDRGKPVDAERCTEVLNAAAREFDQLSFVAWPLAQQPTLARAVRRTYRAAVIDCSEGFQRVLGGMRGVTRRMAGQAERRGVRCVLGERSLDSVLRYYALLQEASVGWGLSRPTIAQRLLESVVRRGGENVELWFAEAEGETIGGGMVLFGRDELFFWSAAMRRDYARYRPSNALNVHLLQRACERGVRWYNLGASEGMQGVERFKHDLGADDVEYAWFTTRSPSYLLYERVRSVFDTKALSR
jgi:hypothetical protein